MTHGLTKEEGCEVLAERLASGLLLLLLGDLEMEMEMERRNPHTLNEVATNLSNRGGFFAKPHVIQGNNCTRVLK